MPLIAMWLLSKVRRGFHRIKVMLVVQSHLPVRVIAEKITDFPVCAHVIVSCLKKTQQS